MGSVGARAARETGGCTYHNFGMGRAIALDMATKQALRAIETVVEEIWAFEAKLAAAGGKDEILSRMLANRRAEVCSYRYTAGGSNLRIACTVAEWERLENGETIAVWGHGGRGWREVPATVRATAPCSASTARKLDKAEAWARIRRDPDLGPIVAMLERLGR